MSEADAGSANRGTGLAVFRRMREAACAWRDRLLSDARFRRWSAAFPLTRPIARRRARAVFDLCAGFVYSQILYACVRLRVLDRVRHAPVSLDDLAAHAGLTVTAAARLLDAAVALGLLEPRTGGRYGLGPVGACVVGNDAVTAMIEHHAMFYDDLRDPVALLRGEGGPTQLSRYWPYAGHRQPGADDDEALRAYSALMAASQTLVADEILGAYPFGRHRRLLDVGGGEGGFVEAVARRFPGVAVDLFDLPAVATVARARLAGAGLGDRARVHGGDFRRDELPGGADVVTLVRVLHDHDDDVAMDLLRRTHDVLPPGGRLIVAEPMADTPGAEPMGDAYFGWYLLAMGSGRARRAGEIGQMLRAAGFVDVRAHATHQTLQVRVISAGRGPGSAPERCNQ